MSANPTPIPFRGGGFAPKSLRHAAPLTFLAVLALWWLATDRGWVSPIALPPPQDVASDLYDMARSGELLKHVTASAQRLVLGWLMGATAGTLIGLAIGLSSLARSTALP